ncbi:uncharacterized protein OCT59_013802 [Rhizophagus irregularis]|uniref:uncharacterized protein n=1 Tax=Rhizophagus irregularis TaxID=588596 RepID=UPI00331806EE|nr:hypothetical protein OCT59_013802 [Rhizophagus irregularis]
MAGENSRVPNRGNQNTNFKSIQSNLYITICRDIYEIFRKYRYIKHLQIITSTNKISPLFTFLQATFTNKILFHWIEHHERLFTENNSSNKGRMKADIVGVRLSDNRQVVFLKMSGAPTDFLNVHTMGDTYKKVQERVDSLNSVLLNFLNYDVRYAKKILSKGSEIALHSDLFF